MKYSYIMLYLPWTIEFSHWNKATERYPTGAPSCIDKNMLGSLGISPTIGDILRMGYDPGDI